MKRILFSLSTSGLLASIVACGSGTSTDVGSGGGGNLGSGGGDLGSGGQNANTGGGPGPSSGGAAVGSGGTGGGAGTGGNAGTGGAIGGSGGAPIVVDRPPLVVSGPDEYWVVGEPTAGAGAATVTVNDAPLRKWKGFGGTFNEAGWDALLELSQEDRDRAIRLLFSATEGANFKWGRIPMGASDYAIERYTYCDDCNPDNVEENFSIAHDEELLLPYIRAAQAVKSDILFWGSPWSPPAWMKNPQRIDGALEGSPDAEMNGTPENLEALAIYQARFVEEYEAAGVPIHHIEPQNEPGYATRYPSSLWDAGLVGTFVGDYLGPAFEARGIDAEIYFGTLSNNDTYAADIGGVFGGSANPNAAGYIKGIGLQWGTYPHIGELQSAHPDLIILQTEHRCGNYRFTVTDNPIQNPPAPPPPAIPPNDHAYMVESWGWFIQWIGGGVNAYSAWNMVLDTVGANIDAVDPWEQNALLVVDRNEDRLIVTPTYYLFRHLSFFVDPEADVLGTTGGSALAFRNPDGSTVAMVYASTAQTVTVSLGGQTLSAPVPAQGFATFYVEP